LNLSHPVGGPKAKLFQLLPSILHPSVPSVSSSNVVFVTN
jgi:hypothetical protein